ncbi:unnamed protein product [Linum trigynum]|uniref:Uncharacterized protein n=1 Tax=Linum trigynum TaxID=586398 RepID=A0AAV2G444_9ROSI
MMNAEGLLQKMMAKLDLVMPQQEGKGTMPKPNGEESADEKDGEKSTTGPKGDDSAGRDTSVVRGSCDQDRPMIFGGPVRKFKMWP